MGYSVKFNGVSLPVRVLRTPEGLPSVEGRNFFEAFKAADDALADGQDAYRIWIPPYRRPRPVSWDRSVRIAGQVCDYIYDRYPWNRPPHIKGPPVYDRHTYRQGQDMLNQGDLNLIHRDIPTEELTRRVSFMRRAVWSSFGAGSVFFPWATLQDADYNGLYVRSDALDRLGPAVALPSRSGLFMRNDGPGQLPHVAPFLYNNRPDQGVSLLIREVHVFNWRRFDF